MHRSSCGQPGDLSLQMPRLMGGTQEILAYPQAEIEVNLYKKLPNGIEIPNHQGMVNTV